MKKIRLVLRSTRTVVKEATHEITVEDHVAARLADRPAELETWALFSVAPLVPATAWTALPAGEATIELLSHEIEDASDEQTGTS